jgi:hypothetical protein
MNDNEIDHDNAGMTVADEYDRYVQREIERDDEVANTNEYDMDMERAGRPQTTIRIKGREFKVDGPTSIYATYILTGPRGATYGAVPAFTNAPGIYKVLGGRYWTNELRIAGNAVHLVVDNGTLREATRADINDAIMVGIAKADQDIRHKAEQADSAVRVMLDGAVR